jgi:hypothetical protein
LDGDELQPDARDIRLNPNMVAGDEVCCGVWLGNMSCNSISGIRNQGWRVHLVQGRTEPDPRRHQSGCTKRRADRDYWPGRRWQGLSL